MSSRFPYHFKAIPKSTAGYREGQVQVYFPTFPMRMIRPVTNQPRDIAVFHVPPRVNKLHISAYLKNLYGVKVNYIRTAIYVERRLHKEEVDFEHLRFQHRYMRDFAEDFAGREDLYTTRYEDWMAKSNIRLKAIFNRHLRCPAYKKVIVNLAEPFMFPPKPDPMAFPNARKKVIDAREEWDRRNPALAKRRIQKEEAEKAVAGGQAL